MINPEMKLRIIPTSEGYYDSLLELYIYNYTDHLGNVRLSYADTNHDGVIQGRDLRVRTCTDLGNGEQACVDTFTPGEVAEVNNYYPFGLLHDYSGTTQNAYQYKYTGKELQETGFTDFGARMYMNDLGRWGVIDNKSEKYVSFSPYHYAGNNPILYVDIDGNEFTEDAWVWVNKLIMDIDSRQGRNNSDIARLRAKIESGKAGEKEIKRLTNRIAGLTANNTELEGVRGEINTLSSSNQVYDVAETNMLSDSNSKVGALGFNFRNGKVYILMPRDGGIDLFAHELKHGYQFEQEKREWLQKRKMIRELCF